MPLNYAFELLKESVFTTVKTKFVNYAQYHEDGTSHTLEILHYLKPRKLLQTHPPTYFINFQTFNKEFHEEEYFLTFPP
jgi:hypothetical protein